MYELTLESYGLFSIDTLKHMKLKSVPWWKTAKNGHTITCLFILLNSNKDQKDSLYSNEWIYLLLLQEELEMEELQLHLHGADKIDCENPGEIFTAGQQSIL